MPAAGTADAEQVHTVRKHISFILTAIRPTARWGFFMPKKLLLELSEKLHKEVKKIAKKEKRSVCAQIRVALDTMVSSSK